jgi:nucleotide-binding universal stress UspA family protein
MPLDFESVHATLVHNFTDNPEGASVTEVAAVRRAQEILEDEGVDVTLQESSGDTAQGILSMAESVDADLLVVAGRKQTPTGKVLFGSVTQGVVLGTDRPVLVCSAPEA